MLMPELPLRVAPVDGRASAAMGEASAETVSLTPIPGREGYYQGRFVPGAVGTFRLTLALPGATAEERESGAARVSREIVVNAVLPLAHGWSLMADRWDVAEKALQLYRDHPKLPDNALTREMVSVLESRDSDIKIRGAREQQGLILMYRAMTAGPIFARPPGNPIG